MPTALEQIGLLQDKIINSENLIKEFENSSNLPNGWLAYAKTNCNVDPTPYINKSKPLFELSFQSKACRDGVNAVIYNNTRIASEKSNIIMWKGQIELLRKDPSVVIAINDAAAEEEAKNKKNRILLYGGLILAALGIIAYFLYKWIRK